MKPAVKMIRLDLHFEDKRHDPRGTTTLYFRDKRELNKFLKNLDHMGKYQGYFKFKKHNVYAGDIHDTKEEDWNNDKELVPDGMIKNPKPKDRTPPSSKPKPKKLDNGHTMIRSRKSALTEADNVDFNKVAQSYLTRIAGIDKDAPDYAERVKALMADYKAFNDLWKTVNDANKKG